MKMPDRPVDTSRRCSRQIAAPIPALALFQGVLALVARALRVQSVAHRFGTLGDLLSDVTAALGHDAEPGAHEVEVGFCDIGQIGYRLLQMDGAVSTVQIVDVKYQRFSVFRMWCVVCGMRSLQFHKRSLPFRLHSDSVHCRVRMLLGLLKLLYYGRVNLSKNVGRKYANRCGKLASVVHAIH